MTLYMVLQSRLPPLTSQDSNHWYFHNRTSRFVRFAASIRFAGMFRPCIDLHEGKVKQIVGGTLQDGDKSLRTNFVSEQPSTWYAELYKRDHLTGGHVIMLGTGNEEPARAALASFPGGLQIGGGINLDNAQLWLDCGASHVIVTSWVFREGCLDLDRLKALVKTIGRKRL